jgi:hypothetical protein
VERRRTKVIFDDTAIASKSQDRLGRAGFAGRLATAILDWEEKDSIVIGLFGPWGCGKTSLLRMALEAVREKTAAIPDAGKPIVVWFDPWMFSDRSDLMMALFHELLKHIEGKRAKVTRDARAHLADYADLLALAEYIPVPAAAPVASTLSKSLKAISKKPSVVDLRRAVDDAFRMLGRRVIVVLDDIDRLTQGEIRTVFQTIKLNADFPNTVYLIAADRSVVEKSLDTEQGISGRAYLEKIVQAAFDVPAPDPSYITDLLDAGLESIVGENPDYWDENRWRSLYYAGFRQLFTNLRDTKRFLSALSFTFPMVKQEVNPVDFIGLEAIRVFAPDVYVEIGRRKSLFLSLMDLSRASENISAGRLYAEASKQEFEAIFDPAEPRIDAVKRICKQLFPLVARPDAGTGVGASYRAEWRSQGRICSEDVFDRCFLLGVPAGDFSRAELTSLAQIAESPNDLIIALREYSKPGLFLRLMDWLPILIPGLTDRGVKGFCEALLTASEEFPDERRSRQTWGLVPKLADMIDAALRKLPDSERCDWLSEQVASAKHLGALVYQVDRDDSIRRRRLATPLFSDECQNKLQKACVRELRKQAESGELRSIRNLPGTLAVWKRWSDLPEELDEYVKQALSMPRSVLDFVSQCVYEIRLLSGPDGPARVDWLLSLETLGELMDLQVLEQTVRDAASKIEVLTERQKLAVEVFEVEMSARGDQGAGGSVPVGG